MIKKSLFFASLMVCLSLHTLAQNVADYVDPFIGTEGMGHTFPGACVPLVVSSLVLIRILFLII